MIRIIKKLLVLLIMVTSVLSLAACNKDEVNTDFEDAGKTVGEYVVYKNSNDKVFIKVDKTYMPSNVALYKEVVTEEQLDNSNINYTFGDVVYVEEDNLFETTEDTVSDYDIYRYVGDDEAYEGEYVKTGLYKYTEVSLAEYLEII